MTSYYPACPVRDVASKSGLSPNLGHSDIILCFKEGGFEVWQEMKQILGDPEKEEHWTPSLSWENGISVNRI